MPEARKTYWHLAAARRMPTDYEIATSKLHYYVGFKSVAEQQEFQSIFEPIVLA